MPAPLIVLLASFACLALADYNLSVPLTDPNITFVGPNWLSEPATGPCSTAPGRFTGSPGEYVTLLFSGIGVYVVSFLQGESSLAVATIDGHSFSIDPRQSTSPSCAILFSQSSLSDTMYNLTMMHNGPISHLILHIADILVTRSGNAPGSLTQSTTPSPTTFTPITFAPTDNPSRTSSSPTSSPTSSSTNTPESSTKPGLSTSDKVALGIGIPGAVASIAAVWTCLRSKQQRS